MRLFTLLICLCLVTPVWAQKHQISSKELASVDAYVQQLMKDWRVVGSSVTIIHKDKVIFSKGYGYRDLDKKLPVTSRTLFGIASNTKLFTAMGAAILHDEKKLDLDKPVRNYFPEIRFATTELDEKLTLRDMLSHRSGVPRWDGVWSGSGYSLQEIVDRLQYLKPTLGFREGYLYNNNMYAAAGAVTARVNGTTWSELIRQRIFEPLEMKHSYFSFEDAAATGEFASDYFVSLADSTIKTHTKDAHCDCWAPAANIVSSSEDLSHWIIAHLNGGTYNGRRAFSPKALAETIRPNNIASKQMVFDEVFYGLYGLGRSSTSYKGHVIVSHGGVISSYRSQISIAPKDSIGIIVLTNTAQGSSMANAAVYGIYDRLLKLGETPWSQKYQKEYKKGLREAAHEADSLRGLQIKGTRPGHDLASYTGKFEHPAYGTMEITLTSEKLHLTFRDRSQDLEHFHFDQFWAAQDPEYPILFNGRLMRLQFLTNGSGKIDRIRTGISTDPEVEFVRK
ncbi:MAG: serine hydrolase [Cyclobacteriaceae bacterium]